MKKPPASISDVRIGTSLHGRQRLPPGPAAGPQAPKSCPAPKPPRGEARAGQPTLCPAVGSTHCPLRPPPAAPQDSVRGSLRCLLRGAGRPSRTGVFGAAAKRSECRALLMPLHGAWTAPAPIQKHPGVPYKNWYYQTLNFLQILFYRNADLGPMTTFTKESSHYLAQRRKEGHKEIGNITTILNFKI